MTETVPVSKFAALVSPGFVPALETNTSPFAESYTMPVGSAPTGIVAITVLVASETTETIPALADELPAIVFTPKSTTKISPMAES